MTPLLSILAIILFYLVAYELAGSRILRYLISALASVVMTLIAWAFAWFFALFIDKNGYLPSFLAWFEPSDNPAIGDVMWAKTNPSYGMYRLAVTYMMRNPAQGFDQWVAAKVTKDTPFKVYGNPDINDGSMGVAGWYLITANRYFHLSYVAKIPFMDKCITGGFGYRLHPLAKGYAHKTLGQVVFTPFRFQYFKS